MLEAIASSGQDKNRTSPDVFLYLFSTQFRFWGGSSSFVKVIADEVVPYILTCYIVNPPLIHV